MVSPVSEVEIEIKVKETEMEMNIDLEQDDQQMTMRGMPLIGNKRVTLNEDTGEEAVSYITDADLVKSDFEEYRALGVPSIDSFTIDKTDIEDLQKLSSAGSQSENEN